MSLFDLPELADLTRGPLIPEPAPAGESPAPAARPPRPFRLWICAHYTGEVRFVAARDADEAFGYCAGLGWEPSQVNDRTDIVTQGRDGLLSVLGALRRPRELVSVVGINRPTLWRLK
jgi:hypothetical protein